MRNCQLSLLFLALNFLSSSLLFSPEASVLLYLHPTQFLVEREGSRRNRFNPILLQTSGEKEERTGEKRRDHRLTKQYISPWQQSGVIPPSPMTLDDWPDYISGDLFPSCNRSRHIGVITSSEPINSLNTKVLWKRTGGEKVLS